MTVMSANPMPQTYINLPSWSILLFLPFWSPIKMVMPWCLGCRSWLFSRQRPRSCGHRIENWAWPTPGKSWESCAKKSFLARHRGQNLEVRFGSDRNLMWMYLKLELGAKQKDLIGGFQTWFCLFMAFWVPPPVRSLFTELTMSEMEARPMVPKPAVLGWLVPVWS